MKKNHKDDILHIPCLLNIDEIEEILSLHKNNEKCWEKSTGSRTTPADEVVTTKIYKEIVLAKVLRYLKEFDVYGGNIFEAFKPYILHTDGINSEDGKDGFVLLIPLGYETEKDHVDLNLFLFEQSYRHGPAKFFKDDPGQVSCFNEVVCDYKTINDLRTGFHLDNELKGELSHLNRKWTEGFSIKKKLPWVPGDMYVFPANQVHCSSNFLQKNVKKKWGLSLFFRYIS